MLRSARLAALLLLAASAACSSATEDVDGSEDAIVDVPHTSVERQSIGNCWLYAHATWIESMHLAATGESFDASQSYWTYWHWFDQIVDGYGTEVQTGGFWRTANDIVSKYGVVPERDFIAGDAREEMSTRQAKALAAINKSLKKGALKDPAVRSDRALVRRELDRAWKLSTGAKKMIDDAFGADVTRNFTDDSANNAGTPIVRAHDFAVQYASGPGEPALHKTLTEAMNEWHEESYGFSDRRDFLLRVQKALHDAQPVMISWFVDFNALENNNRARLGSFNMTTLRANGPGHQGGHMTVLEDYEAVLADGTVLKAGVTLDKSKPEDAAKLAAALEPSTTISFLRIKNSWGGARPDRAFAPGMPGYHDLYMDYLDGPVKQCGTREDGETDTSDCDSETTPFNDVVLPPGY